MIASDLFVVPNKTQNSRVRRPEQFRTALLWMKKRTKKKKKHN